MIGDVLARGRALAEELMTSAVHITRAGPKVRDEATGVETPTTTTVYVGPGRLRASNAQPQEVDAAGQLLSDRDLTLSLPIGEHPGITVGASADVRVGDRGEVILNPEDSGSAGLEFLVRDGHVQTYSTARRLPIEVTSHV